MKRAPPWTTRCPTATMDGRVDRQAVEDLLDRGVVVGRAAGLADPLDFAVLLGPSVPVSRYFTEDEPLFRTRITRTRYR